MNVKGVVFSKDGVILELEGYLGKVYKETVSDILKECSVENEKIFENLMNISGFSKEGKLIPRSTAVHGTKDEIAKKWALELSKNGVSINENFVNRVKKTFFKNRELGEIKATANLKLLISNLKNRHIKIGIATNDEYDMTEYILKRLGIFENVDIIMTADKVKNPKPASDMMNIIARDWRVTKEEILFVGGNPIDLSFARNSGVRGILYSPFSFNDASDNFEICRNLIDIQENIFIKTL